MNIYLNKIKYFFLTCDTNGIRKKHMVEEFSNLNLNEINPVLNIEKFQSVATGFSRMIDMGLKSQDRTKPFQPFGLFEDDVSKFREFPDNIKIPNDTDILYIGLSKCGMNSTSWMYKTYYSEIDNNIIRIYNMLSLHGIIICSASGALAVQKCMMETYFKINKCCDTFMAHIQPYYNIYALKIPLVYQDKRFKGLEAQTKIIIDDVCNEEIPEKYINKSNISIITCNK